MCLFTSVSKLWRRILMSPYFTHNRSQIYNLDPPGGLFVSHNRYPFKCDFVSLDSRFESKKGTIENSFTLASTEAVDNVKIVRSCNCLLLCTGLGCPAFNYVYNLSTNLFKMLLPPDYSHADSHFYTSNRKLCRDGFNFFSFDHFDSAIYWNGALHWLETEDIQDGVYNRRTKKIMETMNVTFDELSAMAFEQRSSKLGFQSMTSGQISSGLGLTYALSTIKT
ncbi:hypothetical protein Tco_0184374 [Tanacetum coccineum]